ncbi:MAG: hypothetical protein H6Q19_942 [Bacteroidetes bacterium]|nr:hypothetical protein [Bacteroidota bacterium]
MKFFFKINNRFNVKKSILNPPFGGWGGFFFFLIFVTSCIETVDIDTKDVKPKIVLNGIIEADSAITVRISKTYPFTNDFYENHGRGSSESTDTIVPNFLPQAKPVLYINDVQQGELNFVKNDTSFSSNGSVFHSEFRPKVGDKVKIEVSASGFETVWAETVIPQPIQIHQVDTSTFITKENYGYVDGYVIPDDAKSLNMALGINIENPNKEKEGFYSIEIYQEWMIYYYWIDEHGWMHPDIITGSYMNKRNLELNTSREPLFSENTEDQVLQFFLEDGHSKSKLYFTDKQFENKRYKLNLSVWGYYFHQQYSSGYEIKPEFHDEPLIISILSMSPEMYRASNNDYSEMDNYLQLFSEPEVTFTNVHNGVGVLGSCSSTKMKVVIPRYTGEY